MLHPFKLKSQKQMENMRIFVNQFVNEFLTRLRDGTGSDGLTNEHNRKVLSQKSIGILQKEKIKKNRSTKCNKLTTSSVINDHG